MSKAEVNIPQLTLAKITQFGRHETVVTTTVLGLQIQSMLE